MFIGCSKNNPIETNIETVFESETFALEIKPWNALATNNSASKYEPWNGLAGITVGDWLRNGYTFPLKVV